MFRTIRTVAVLAIAIAATALVPSSAHATVGQPIAMSGRIAPNYQGWAYARHHCVNLLPCTTILEMREAWRWNGRSWSTAPIAEGTLVYAWPYASGWHWAWTQRTGWLAMRTSDIVYSV
jgi:hypothetical protein